MANDPQQFRVQDDRFDDTASPAEPPKKRSALATCLTGCLIVFVVVIILLLIVSWWIYRNLATWTGDFAKAAISETELPPEEVRDISVQIDRLSAAANDGKLSLAQFFTFVQEFAQSPLMTTLIVSAVDKQYITPSGLSDEEKTEARVTIQRFMRGLLDNKITQAQFDKAMEPVGTKKSDGTFEMKKQVTDDELRQFLTNAKTDADAAEIPQDVPAVDPSDEFKRLVDKTLEEGAVEPAGENAAPTDEATTEDAGEPAGIDQPAEQNP